MRGEFRRVKFVLVNTDIYIYCISKKYDEFISERIIPTFGYLLVQNQPLQIKATDQIFFSFKLVRKYGMPNLPNKHHNILYNNSEDKFLTTLSS